MSAIVRQFLKTTYNIFNKQPELLKPTTRKCFPSLTSIFKNYSNQFEQITPHEVVNPKEDELLSKETFDKINRQISAKTHGRLFAIVHLCGKQFKITTGDCLVIEGFWPPDAGDKISLNKVLLVGSTDFTLIGRPLLQTGLVNIQATVIEKSLSHTKTHFKKKRRKQYQRINFYRFQQTMLRINTIDLCGELNNPPEVTESKITY